MRESILIKMSDPLAKKVEWVVRTKTRIKKPKIGSLKDAAKACGKRRIVLIIPGNEVLLTSAEVPTRNRQRLLKALPYTLEEYLINDVESQHFAIKPSKTGNRHPVAVISKEVLDGWLKFLHDSCGIKPELVIPDTLLVPRKKGWNIVITKNQCYVRTGPFSGFNCSPSEMLNYFEIALNHSSDDKPTTLNCWTNPKNITNEIIEFFVKHKIKLKFEKPDKTLILLQAKYFNDNSVINLLQGSYGSKRTNNEYLQKWMPVAASFLVWLAITFTSNVAHYFEMKNEVSNLEKEALMIYKTTFPDARKFTRLRKNMSKQFRKLQKKQGIAQHSFMELLGATGDATKNIKSLELTKLKFENSELSIYFVIDDTSKIDQIEQSLRRAGLKVDRGPSNRSENGYSSNLTISGSRS